MTGRRSNARMLAALLAGALFGAGHLTAEEPSTAGAPDAGTDAQSADGAAPDEAPAARSEPEREFTPSERISEDYSVDFPVDI